MMIYNIKNTKNIYTIYKCLHYFITLQYYDDLIAVLYVKFAVLYVDAKVSKWDI